MRFAAAILDQGATAYAAYAAGELAARVPGAPEPAWREHLMRCVQELAAALRAGEPSLFVSRVAATRESFRSRGLRESDVAAGLAALRDVLAERLPENARKDALAFIDAALAAPEAEQAAALEAELALRYLQAALEGDTRRAIKVVLDAIDGGLDPRDAYTDVLLPAQREIGRLWHAGEVSIAEEHHVTETTQRAMAIVAELATRAPANGRTVLAAAVAGNLHVVGVRAVANLFEMAGWRAVCLGADVPADDVAAAAEFFEADVVLISAALATQLKAVEETIAALRAGAQKPRIMVGGSAFEEAPDLWRRLGADAYAATGVEAVELAG